MIVEAAGFEALATTSLGVAISQGKRRADETSLLENCRHICDATDLPVTADFENGFADDPETVAARVNHIFETGAVGFSIEDSTGEPNAPLYEFELALERVEAVVDANARLPVPMVVTARAENLLYEPTQLEETIRRLQAYERAGADVLYAPYIRDLDVMRQVVSSVTRPVNVVMGFADPSITLADLAGIGVSRVSIGGGLCRLAMQAAQRAATMMSEGDFRFVSELVPLAGLTRCFTRGD